MVSHELAVTESEAVMPNSTSHLGTLDHGTVVPSRCALILGKNNCSAVAWKINFIRGETVARRKAIV